MIKNKIYIIELLFLFSQEYIPDSISNIIKFLFKTLFLISRKILKNKINKKIIRKKNKFINKIIYSMNIFCKS